MIGSDVKDQPRKTRSGRSLFKDSQKPSNRKSPFDRLFGDLDKKNKTAKNRKDVDETYDPNEMDEEDLPSEEELDDEDDDDD